MFVVIETICEISQVNKKNHQNSDLLALPSKVANLLKLTEIEFIISLMLFLLTILEKITF